MTPSIDDVPAYEPAAPPLWATPCSDCGAAANAPYVTVARFPDPTIDDPRESRARCHDCYADLLGELAPIARRPARVVALQLAGYSTEQIAAVVGRSGSTVRQWSRQARKEHGDPDATEGIAPVFRYL